MQASFRPEDWSRHAQALRRLAAELVASAEQREELVQSTLVAALERPPRALSWRWLATVLRNRAKDLARTRARHGPTQALPPLASALPEAAEIAQRLELQEDVTQALRALAEPYQSTLYLRYFEELAPAEIARRTGVPVKTVKTRLERGLALLRARLEPRHGPDVRALLVLLRPLPILPAPSLSASLAAAGLTLMWKKTLLLAVALLLLALLWRTTRSAAHVGVAEPPGAPALARAAAQEAPTPAPAASSATREARPVAASEALRPPAPARGALRVHVLWSDGTSAPDVAIDLRTLSPSPRVPERGLTRVLSDAEGWAVVRELAPGDLTVQTGRGASARAEIVAGEVRELVLRLEAGLEVEGRVLDEHDAPVAGADVWLTSRHLDWLGLSPVGRTDAAGRFHLRDVPATQSLGASAPGRAPSKLVDLELAEAASPLAVVLRLDEPGAALAGRVLDAHGAPVAEASVCVGWKQPPDFRRDGTVAERWTPRAVRSDAGGRFRLEGLAPGVVSVAVRAPDAPPWSSTLELTAGATAALDVELQASATLEGTVRDVQGAPVARAFVRVFAWALAPNYLAMGQYDDPSVFGSPLTLTDADGRYRLENVWPGEVYAYASPPRAGDDFHAEFHAEAVLRTTGGATLAWNPVLGPGRTVRGRVRYADGEPMPGVFVSAVEAGAAERRTLTADDAGRFEFFCLPPGPFRIQVQLDDAPPGARELSAEGVFPDGPELELVADLASPEKNPCARVRGRLADPLGRFPRPLTPTLETPNGVGVFADSSDGGAFEFRGLSAGTYRLLGHHEDTLGYVGPEFELARGEELDLGALELLPGAALRVRLRRAPGLADVRVQGYLQPRDVPWGTVLDFSRGDELALPSVTCGSYQLRLYCGTGAAQQVRELELTHDTELELPVVPGAARRIELAFGPEAARGTLHLVVRDAGGQAFEDAILGRWNERSPFVFELAVPPGRYGVRAETSSGLAASGELVVEAAATTEAPLRLELR